MDWTVQLPLVTSLLCVLTELKLSTNENVSSLMRGPICCLHLLYRRSLTTVFPLPARPRPSAPTNPKSQIIII